MEFRKYLESYNFNIEQEELVEESFLNPDKTLVWFEKPIEKLLNKTISIYHGSPTRIEDDKILPLGVNVGATKFSKLRWSAYYWDNPKYAMMWATCWGLHDAGIPATFVGQNNYVYVCNKTGLDNKEFKQMIVDKKIQTYIYEVRLKASELEMGSCPIIKEYTVSKPMQIYKKYVLTIDEETIDEYCIIVDEAEFNRANSYIMSRTHVPKVRGFILNAILDKYRDIYRHMVYDMIRQDHGRFNPDANLKPYQKQVNKAIKNDVYGVKEGVEMKKEEYIIEGRIVEFYDCDILEEGICDKFKKKKKEQEPVKQNNPEPVRKGKILPGDQVRSDMKKIVAEVKKIMNQPGIKEFNNNGLEIMKPNEWYDSTDPESDEYEAGVDEFTIVRIDLWDYNGGNPRVIMNESPDGWHPVDHGLEKLRSAIRKLLTEKFPDYRLLEYGGDWDTGYVEIGIK
jgi:hypothetical protein